MAPVYGGNVPVRRWRQIVAAACCGLLALAATALAAGGWSNPVRISGGDDDVIGQKIALNRAGTGTVAWLALDGNAAKLRVATRGAKGRFAAPQTLGDAVLAKGSHRASFPAVGVDGNGKATVAWVRPDADDNLRVVAASQRRNGSFASPETLSEPGVDAYQPQIAVNDGGEAVVVWQAGDKPPYGIEEATRSADAQSFGSSTSISDSAVSAEAPQVGLGDAGRTIVTWLAGKGSPYIEAVSRADEMSGFSAPQPLSESAANIGRPQLAVGSDGAAFAAWEEGNLKDVNGIGWAYAPPTDPFQPGQFVLNPEDRKLVQMSVGIDDRGGATLLWVDQPQNNVHGDDIVRAATSREGGPLTPDEVLARNVDITSQRVAVSGNGAAVATWTDSPQHDHPTVRAALRRSDRSKFAPAQVFDGPGAGARGADAAIAGSSAVIVWEATRGENDDSAGVAAARRKSR
jgi:hypothetical protein